MDSMTRDLLPVYWNRIFPWEPVYEWLNYGEEMLFGKREFVLNFGNGDRFLRNVAFDNVEELKAFIKKEKPNKMDIGAVYAQPPQLGKARVTGQYPVQKELVLDIDLSDYDEVRTCCSKANICTKCWKYITLGVKILDTALRIDYGYKHILWVYSGRRGVHAWICDKEARSLSSEARLAICNYLQIVEGGDYVNKRVHLRDKIHVSESRALKIIDKVFVELCVVEQDMLGTEAGLEKFLRLLPEWMRESMKEYLERYPTSLLRWNAFVKLYNRNKRKLRVAAFLEQPFLIEEIKLQYAYPRLDLQVTHSMSHLLKAPFSIHPKTGTMGVPIDHNNIDQFDPHSLPTIPMLMEELDKYYELGKKKYLEKNKFFTFVKWSHDLEKTSLERHYKLFCSFVERLRQDN